MPPRGAASHPRCMPAQPQSTHAAFGKRLNGRVLEADSTINWGCSLKGWNCCVDKGIVVRPYDMVRLRHAAGRSSNELTSDGTVTFAWHPPTGALVGSLAHRPYENGRVACVFLDEVTDASARTLRAADPLTFEELPERVRRAADRPARQPWRVAGLCSVHTGRPEVCRAFPFQRFAQLDARGETTSVEVQQVFQCGSCALSTPTTAREVMSGEGLDEYWRANDAFMALVGYYRALGAARTGSPELDTLPLSEQELGTLWGQMYLPDADEQIVARFGEQWRTPLDVEGDRELYRIVLERARERVERVATEHGVALDTIEAPRPDFDSLLDPARQPLPPAEELAVA